MASSPEPRRAMRVAHRLIGPQIVRWFRVETDARDHVPAAGPVILASNHVSNLDNYVLSAATPRPPCFLGKAQLAAGLFGRFNRAMGMVPVQRGKGDWEAIDTVIRLLAEGEIVALFPEGTRSPSGELFKFRSGLARIAAAAQAPVLPVGVVGTREVWAPGGRLPARRPPRGLIRVRYSTPLAPPADTPRARRSFTAEVRAAITGLTGQALADGYAPVATDSNTQQPTVSG